MYQLIRAARFHSYSVIPMNDPLYPVYFAAGYLFLATGRLREMEELQKDMIQSLLGITKITKITKNN